MSSHKYKRLEVPPSQPVLDHAAINIALFSPRSTSNRKLQKLPDQENGFSKPREGTINSMKRYETKHAKLVKINVSGKWFITTEHSLDNYPQTLLGNKKWRNQYYNEKLKCLFFDRNQDVFSSILYFYQSPGMFRAPEHIESTVVEEEMEFFKINLEKMAEQGDVVLKPSAPVIPPTKLELLHNIVSKHGSNEAFLANRTMNDPSTNRFAACWGLFDMVCIVTSICMLVIESIPKYAEHFKNDFDQAIPVNMVIYSMDVVINGFFTLDLVIRFIAWPGKLAFIKNPMCILDILAVVPFYVELIMIVTGNNNDSDASAYVALKVCRIVRVVRVMKVVRHSKQLGEVMQVVSSASKEFIMLTGIVCLFVLLFGTVMFYVEGNHTTLPDTFNATLGENNPLNTPIASQFTSIPAGCWWAIVTITTVGYGDLSPLTMVGKLLGSLVVLSGIVILAFPMTIIISKFQESFQSRKIAEDREMTHRLRIAAEHFRSNKVLILDGLNGDIKESVELVRTEKWNKDERAGWPLEVDPEPGKESCPNSEMSL